MDPTLRGKYRMLQMCVTGMRQCKGIAVFLVVVVPVLATVQHGGRLTKRVIAVSPVLGKHRMLNIGFGCSLGLQEAGLSPFISPN